MRYNSDDPEGEEIQNLDTEDTSMFGDDFPPEEGFESQEAYDRHIEVMERLDKISNDTDRILSLVTSLAAKQSHGIQD